MSPSSALAATVAPEATGTSSVMAIASEPFAVSPSPSVTVKPKFSVRLSSVVDDAE
ncbi:hypothetical protein GFPCMMHI_05006 [Ensifer adhaerens]|nr:hypothetical protein [Ensifer adhaerens]